MKRKHAVASQEAAGHCIAGVIVAHCCQVGLLAAGHQPTSSKTAASLPGSQRGWGAQRALSHRTVWGCPSWDPEVCGAVPGAEWSGLPLI